MGQAGQALGAAPVAPWQASQDIDRSLVSQVVERAAEPLVADAVLEHRVAAAWEVQILDEERPVETVLVRLR